MEYPKYIEVDGETFRLTGHYYKRHITIFLHRYVWEKYNGIIPEGHHIHHKDGNKLNNDISNLECLSASDHHKRTWADEREKKNKIARQNMKKAIEWRSKPESKQAIIEKNTKAWNKRFPKQCICIVCGNTFESRLAKLAKYCTKKCCKTYHKEKKNDMADKQSDS